jgi:hypothetical protein
MYINNSIVILARISERALVSEASTFDAAALVGRKFFLSITAASQQNTRRYDGPKKSYAAPRLGARLPQRWGTVPLTVEIEIERCTYLFVSFCLLIVLFISIVLSSDDTAHERGIRLVVSQVVAQQF